MRTLLICPAPPAGAFRQACQGPAAERGRAPAGSQRQWRSPQSGLARARAPARQADRRKVLAGGIAKRWSRCP